MAASATNDGAKPTPLDLITRAELADIGHKVDIKLRAFRINKLEVGRLIRWAHDKLRGRYGAWAKWLKDRDISAMTAWNYEKLAERFKGAKEGADPKYREAGMYADMSSKPKKAARRSRSGEVVIGAVARLGRFLRDHELMRKYPAALAKLKGKKREKYRKDVDAVLEQLHALREQLEAPELVAV